ncbi:hypothetical protein QBC40DRAFT_345941 [Triangularia verruculosa]|uniref:Uncharacterized protein n=1 Tax=Triangularia verruculosa TaxID=2587418 RepID=A0AAN6XUB5_9PEZI|nr:hypothetical protein QBC40DRAFT_345941 [Triangularia verruculosa]
MVWSQLWTPAVTGVLLVSQVHTQQTGNNPDWPRWCGKVYEAGYPNFDPGGQTPQPRPHPCGCPLLHVQFQPRYSLYLSSESQGEFVVNADFSPFHGTIWPPTNSSTQWANRFIFSINSVETDVPLVQATVPVNTTGNRFQFNLSRLGPPRLDPYPVVLYGAPESGQPSWTVIANISYLPDKLNGSVTRTDNLKGGLWVKNAASNNTFAPYLPYGFYASHDNFLRENDTKLIDAYQNLGLTGMVPLASWSEIPEMLSYMDDIDLKYMYNLRYGYKNVSYVTENVLQARDHPGIFAYWTADEPDGWQDPFDLSVQAQSLIHQLDPYHPAVVTLNCQNYYFKEYSSGADIIMSDVYPIGINSTFSKWGTECNVTHGDCGCDNCQGIVQDVSDRLDTLSEYEKWLGLWPKTKFHNPQSFHGQDYWLRDPTVEEEHAMNVLAFNHGMKGIISWLWPSSTVLAEAHGKLAKVVTRSPVKEFLVGGDGVDGPGRVEARVPGTGIEIVDAAVWVDKTRNKALIGVVNGGYADIERRVEVPVVNATTVDKTLWGGVEWRVEGELLVVDRLPALATSFVLVNLRG